MRKRWRWLSLVVAFLLGASALGVLLEPTETARALLAGEPFYQGRPARFALENACSSQCVFFTRAA